MYVDDASDAIIFLLKNYSSNDVINIGTGDKITIKKLSQDIAMTVGYNDELVFDNTKPDGARCKVKDVLKLNSLGCSRTTKLEAGLKNIYTWFKGNIN